MACFSQLRVVFAENLKNNAVLKIPKPRSNFDISHDYHLTLLNMALTEAAQGRPVPTFKILNSVMSQGRATIELINGDTVDVYWLGADQALDKQLRAIKIPTTRGLIGYRKFIIRQSSVQAFDQVNSISDLQQFVACQGSHWPDTKILSAAQLQVATSTVYSNLFKMLDAKRGDYFPRGIHDIKNELGSVQSLYPDLIKYDRLLMHYPFAVYFYTNQSNEVLAQWIETGMKSLSTKGAIEKLMKAHPLTAHVYPLNDESETIYVTLSNPLQPADDDVNDERLWILPKDFNIEVN